MLNKDLYTILLSYLEGRRNGNLSMDELRSELRTLGKLDDEIHFLLEEFEFEWTLEGLKKDLIRKATMQIILGLSTSLIVGAISIYMAINKYSTDGRNLLSYGGMAAGFILALKGGKDLRLEKRRLKRRELKWKAWK